MDKSVDVACCRTCGKNTNALCGHNVGIWSFRERDHWVDPDVDGRIILRWIFGKWEGMETGWSWLRIGTDGGHL